jgi:hypothetical protein
MRSVVDLNVVMQRITVQSLHLTEGLHQTMEKLLSHNSES